MEENMKLGMNKTGVDMSPMLTRRMVEGLDEFMPAAAATGANRQLFPEQFYSDGEEGLGSVPLPGTLKGMVKSTAKLLSGRHPEVLINKLGERLAYERSGVRIYDQLIHKCQALADTADVAQLSVRRLEEFRSQEKEHFVMLVEALQMLGADPTAQTPDADASGVAAQGLMKVIVDPRTSISQSLEAMLSVELTDNVAWQLLIKLAMDMNLDELAERFRHAQTQEDVHLSTIKTWYEDSVRTQE